jgi:putative ABC transport system permease protein
MTTFWQDLRFALRDLRKGFLVTSLAVLSLALAIAGNTTVFGLVNALLFRPLPYPESDRIVLLGEREESAQPTLVASPGNLVDWRQRSRSFTDLAGFQPLPMSLGAGERPEPVVAARVSPRFFELLGARPLRGRMFRTEEGTESGHRVVVLSHLFWQERFGQEDDPVGDTMILNHESYTVVGVLPEDFEFFNPQVELWLPLPLELENMSRDERSVLVVGRLRPGVTMDQARADMKNVHEQLVEEYPEANRGFVVDVFNLRYDVPDRRSRILFGLLQGAVVFVLLIACVNIANLLLARTQGRRREIALRSVLGAGRIRVVRQLLTESVLLAVMGGVLGLLLGMAGLRILTIHFASILPQYWVPVVDARVLAMTFSLTALAGLVFGLLPAWMSTKVNIADVVKEAGRGAAGSRRRLLTRALVVAEIALSIVLLGGGSVLVQSFLSIRSSDPGFNMKNLLTVTVSIPEGDDVNPVALTERLLETAGSLPGVAQAAATSVLPQNIFTTTASYSIDEKPPSPDEVGPRAVLVVATPDYRESLGFPILRGRFFEMGDRNESPPVVVISQSVAERHWPEKDPVGERLTLQGTSREVVGIVGDVRQSIINQGEGSQGTVYVPFAQQPVRGPFLLVRCRMDPHALAGALRNELTAIDPRLAIGQIQTMQEFVDQFFLGVNFFNTILVGFGFLALLLAALGTYGVLAYNVTQRSQEIGVRMALGASPRRILRMVTRQGATLGVLGLALGAPGVLAIVRILDSVRVSAPPLDPLTIVVVFAVLFMTTLAASWVPARRAAGLDPMSVLREE